MNIRPATRDDVPAIVDMATKFYAETPHAKHVPLKKECAAGLAIITMDAGTMLVAEDDDGRAVAMLCAYIDHFTFNDEAMMVNELAFWVDESHRGTRVAMRLIKRMREICQSKGVKFFNMASMSSSPEAAGRLYQALGLNPVATIYMDALT